MEYIIENVTNEEFNIIKEHCDQWYPDSLDSNDICFEYKRDYDLALRIIGRKGVKQRIGL